jgi:ammonium transporter, Amt family
MKNFFKYMKYISMAAMIAVGCCLFAQSVNGADPTGASYATATVSKDSTLQSVATAVTNATYGVNFVWVMITGFMVFFFQCGFAMVETGLCRTKNSSHTITMNFMVFLVGCIGYFINGFALQYGGYSASGLAPTSLGTGVANALNGLVSIPGLGGIFGTKGFFLQTGGTYDVGIYALFFFQMVFMDTTVTIPTGSMAERVKYSAVIISSFFVSMIYYPLFGNWMWGGGWLAQIGKTFGLGNGGVDFAGSAVVHSMGGMMALAGAIVIGPRIGKYKKDGSINAFPAHHIPMAIIGTIILFFCWFSFNAGSTLNGTDFRLAVVATNTMIAGAIGGLVALFFVWARYGKPDPSMTINGALAGLVAITAPCAFVPAWAAFVIGAIAGVLVCLAVPFIDRKLKIDDPVGAISVHCVNGVWGVISLGLFADGSYGAGWNGVASPVTGLFYGNPSQLVAQLIVVAVLIVWGFGLSFVWFKFLDKVWGLRVPASVELEGLDIPEMGTLGYADFVIEKGELDSMSPLFAEVKELKHVKNIFANSKK